MFGMMTEADRMRWGYRHRDHHLRRFGGQGRIGRRVEADRKQAALDVGLHTNCPGRPLISRLLDSNINPVSSSVPEA